MSLTNDFRMMGFCAQKPVLKRTLKGKPMAVLVVYSRDWFGQDHDISQAHRCLFFGKKAEWISKMADRGRHIHVRGMIRSQRKGEGNDARYYTSVIVEEFQLSPRQSVESLKDAVREIIKDNNIKSCDELGIFQE